MVSYLGGLDSSSSQLLDNDDLEQQRVTFALSGLRMRLDSAAPTSPFASLPFQFSLREVFSEPAAAVVDVQNLEVHDDVHEQNDLLQYVSHVLLHDYTCRDPRSLLHDGVVVCRVLDRLIAGSDKPEKVRKYMHGSRSSNLKRAFQLASRLGLTNEVTDLAELQDFDASHRMMCSILDEARARNKCITNGQISNLRENSSDTCTVIRGAVGSQEEQVLDRPEYTNLGTVSSPNGTREEALGNRCSVQSPISAQNRQHDIYASDLQGHSVVRPETAPLTVLPLDSVAKPVSKLNRSKSVEPRDHNHVHSSDQLKENPNTLSSCRKSIITVTGQVLLLGDVLGRGQFGTVYRAIDTSQGRILAIKQIPVADRPPGEVGNMMKEIEILKALTSPHIVKYEGFHEDEHFVSIIVEFVENGSLRKTIRTFGCFNEKLSAGYTNQILKGLVYLHSKDVVHCDVKCANVLTTKSGEVKLSDFGISLFLLGQSTIKHASVNGTPNWLAPEVISLRGTTKASDIWALGCTILEMLTGNPPYHTQNAMSTMYSIVEDEHPPLPSSLSDELRGFLLSCFKKEPRARSTANDLLRHPWISRYHPSERLNNDDQRAVVDQIVVAEEAAQEETILSPQIGESPKRANSTKIDHANARTSPSTQALYPSNIQTVNHVAVSTFFSQPVTCRICGVPVKSAMYCHHCRIVAHSDCLATSRKACARDPHAPQGTMFSTLEKTDMTPKNDKSALKPIIHSTKDYAADKRRKCRPAQGTGVRKRRLSAGVTDNGACAIM